MRALATRPLGRTGVPLPELGLGCAPLGDLFTHLDEKVVDACMAEAWDAGIRFFDTAPHYGAGLSEHRLGRFLRTVPRDEFVLSTKVGRLLRPDATPDSGGRGPFVGGLPFAQVFDYGYDAVLRSHEDSLQRLGLVHVDLLVIHDLDVRHHPDADVLDRHLNNLARGGARGLEQLRDAGSIRALGAGVNEIGMIARLLERVQLDFVLLAMPYTLLDQDALDDELPLCLERGIGVIVGAPFASGVLASDEVAGMYRYARAPAEVVERVGRMRDLCARHGVSLPTAALRFPFGHPSVAAVIPGAVSGEQVRENVARFSTDVPAALWDDLKAAGLLRSDAPAPASARPRARARAG